MYKLDLIFLSLLIGIPIMYNFDLMYSTLCVIVIVCLICGMYYDYRKCKERNKTDNSPKPITAAEAVIKADKVPITPNTVKAPIPYKASAYNTSHDDNLVVDTIKTVVAYEIISDIFFDD